MEQRTQEAHILATDITFAAYQDQFAGQHAEWINGVVIAMSPVSKKHDDISQFLSVLFTLYLLKRAVAVLRTAPTTMYLGDDLPAREPDLQIILNEHAERNTDTYVDGPADWVIEIVSPESSARDRGIKFDEYERGGVNEYWIIDPQRDELLAYRRDEEGIYQPISSDEDGHITSATLPDFRLEVAQLWQVPLPAETYTALVERMLAS